MRPKRRLRPVGHSAKMKLELLFAIVAIIPMLSIGYISIRTFSNAVLERSVQQSLSRLELVEYRTVETMRQKHADALLIAFNPNVRAYFETDDARLPSSRSVVENETRKQIISLFNSREETAVRLVSLDGTVTMAYDVTHSGIQLYASKAGAVQLSRFRIFDAWGKPTYVNSEASLPYLRLVLDTNNSPIGVLQIFVKEALFRELYSGYVQPDGNAFYILNAEGKILSSSVRDAFGGDFQALTGIDPSEFSKERGYFGKNGCTFAYRTQSARALTFVEQIPNASITSGMRPILYSTLLVGLISLAVCVLLGTLMARSFTQPLYRLIHRIRSRGVPANAKDGAASRDEIAFLTDQFDNMIDQLETLIGEYYEEQRKKKEAEIRALEFQINPHFLYNTLSTIVWLVEANERRDAIRVTKELAAFFRISISKGREMIPISEELRHVELYLNIQSVRYEGIDFHMEVPEELQRCFTPKLILQPLVENCVIHGMQADADKHCVICVRAHEEGDDLVFEVIDDGPAATEQAMEELNLFLRDRSLKTGRNYGIGITNVHDRVRMCFGEGYGLQFSRTDGKTCARVRIRKMKEAGSDV